MARAIWSGVLSFGLVSIPVRLYTATAAHQPAFHQFEKGITDRIRYQRVNERTGHEVEYSDAVKGADIVKPGSGPSRQGRDEGTSHVELVPHRRPHRHHRRGDHLSRAATETRSTPGSPGRPRSRPGTSRSRGSSRSITCRAGMSSTGSSPSGSRATGTA